MLDLLSLLIFYRNKDIFDKSKSFQKEREKRRKNKEKKKRERGGKNAFPKVFVKCLQNRLCNGFEIFSRSFFIYFGQKIQNINIWPLPTPI